MDKKRRIRYRLAIYLVVASLAAIFLLIGINNATGTWQSVLLNLSTELLGVVLLFFIVNYLFLMDDWSLSERIEKLVSKLEMAERPSAKDFFSETPKIDPYIAEAKKIDLCGVSLTSTINKQLTRLRERLQEGANVRLLVVNPNSLAVQMSTLRSEEDDIEYFQKRMDSTFKDIDYLFRNLRDYKLDGDDSQKGTLEVRLLSYAPSFGLSSFEIGSSNKLLFVELYPHHAGYGSPPHFKLTPQNDGDWFEYFSNQFDVMWAEATDWQPEILSTNSESLRSQYLRRNAVADKFFLSENVISDQTFSSANIIFLSGMTLIRTTREYMYILGQRLSAGATIRIMILDSNDDLLKELALRSFGETTPEYWKNRLDSVSSVIEIIAKTSEGQGRLEIGYLPYIPSFGFTMIEPDDEIKGMCFLELYHHKSAEPNPRFILAASVDVSWYRFFRNQFEILWDSCRVEVLKPTEEDDGVELASGH